MRSCRGTLGELKRARKRSEVVDDWTSVLKEGSDFGAAWSLGRFGVHMHTYPLANSIHACTLTCLRAVCTPLAPSGRLGMALDLADGLSYLHGKRIIHRDLTTANCMIREAREGRQVVIVDFGLARVMEGETMRLGQYDDVVSKGRRKRSRRVSTSAFLSLHTEPPSAGEHIGTQPRCMSIVGSPFNMAPEMMASGSYGLKADIFSFGIILCEIIGRCESDPDVLPRNRSFGIDESAFR